MTGEYAGITCLGNATINLADGTTNTVRGMKGSFDEYSGIFVPHNDTGEGDEYTLTIRGTGTLNVFGGQNAAGIGANSLYDSGNIVIAGGIINATGGENAAGIGTGEHSTCGDITIENTVTSVTAIKGENANESIGRGSGGSCGMVTIGGTVYYDGSNFQNDGDTKHRGKFIINSGSSFGGLEFYS